MKHSRRTVLAAAGAALAPASAEGAERLITGVNLAGLEFNDRKLPGRLDHDYVAPTVEELDYYAGCGARAVRIPFLWERLEPRMGGEFDDAYWRLLSGLIEAAGARRMHLILDPHQYGRRRGEGGAHVIAESAQVSGAQFAAFWRELARRCRGHGHVVFGLQNEPHDQDQATLARVHTGAIAAIRAAGARNLVLAPGSAWSGAHSWVSSGNAETARAVADPLGRMAYDVHQFLDHNSSGTNAGCVAGAGARRLAPFTLWARQHGKRGFLGEFGGGPSEGCARELSALLEYISRNRDVWLGWTCWAGGPWWDDDYPLSLEPASLRNPQDRPQMAVLRRYFE